MKRNSEVGTLHVLIQTIYECNECIVEREDQDGNVDIPNQSVRPAQPVQPQPVQPVAIPIQPQPVQPVQPVQPQPVAIPVAIPVSIPIQYAQPVQPVQPVQYAQPISNVYGSIPGMGY